jgi:hypothetical protein
MTRHGVLRVVLVLAATLLAGVAALSAQTTGGIIGRVTDEDGGALPGVTVTATSSALQGARVTVSDGAGEFRLPLLPPGAYDLVFELAGFGTEKGQVSVGLGHDTTFSIFLHPTTSEEITVTGAVPDVDPRSSSVGTNFSAQAIETLPSGRNYSSLIQVAAGVSSDANPENSSQSTLSFYGSSGAENTFYVDGVNTTGVEYGFQGKELNFEFIQEIEVKAGGYEAEYGKSTGGIVNVITKSGGNTTRGDVFGYFDNDSLQASPSPVVSTSGTVQGYTKQDYGLDLGGYIVRDRLWYFAAYDRVSNSTDTSLPAGPQAGQTVTSDSSRDLSSLKLTYNLAQGHSLVGTYFGDPRQDTGAIVDGDHSLNGDPLTYQGKHDYGGDDYGARYDGVAGTWVFDAQAARHTEQNSVGPRSAAGDVVEFRDYRGALDGFQTGGFGLIQKKDFTRDFYGGSASFFSHQHEVKFGLEYEKEEATVIKRMSGGQRVDILTGASGLPVYSHFYWTTPEATIADAPTSQLDATPKHENTTAYLQDRWRPTSSLTLNFGVRWDRQEIFDRFGAKVIDLKKDYAPRVGLVWDPTGKGEAKLFASYGHYYEQIPMDLVIRSFAQERQARIFNYSPTGTSPDAAAENDLDRGSIILGGYSEPADPNLRNQYIREAIVGYESKVARNWTAGAKAIWRQYGRVIEDFLCIDDGTYCIGNPGEGLMRMIYTYDYSRTLPAPKARRDYKGVELTAVRHMSDNWQMTASYLWSKLEGNYDGEYSPFTNVGADPNISAAYDYYDFFTDGRNLDVITNKGPLSNDRRHQVKLTGSYQTPFKLVVGAAAYYRTGTPITRYGFSDGYGRYEYFLTPRGAEGRVPASYEADLHLGYPLAVGPVTVNLLLDVFNLLNAQKPILLDQRWDFQEADNFSPTPTNPNYKKPVLRTPPTSIRLGVRVSF